MELGLANSNFCTEVLMKLILTKHWNFAVVTNKKGILQMQNHLV